MSSSSLIAVYTYIFWRLVTRSADVVMPTEDSVQDFALTHLSGLDCSSVQGDATQLTFSVVGMVYTAWRSVVFLRGLSRSSMQQGLDAFSCSFRAGIGASRFTVVHARFK